MKTPIFTRSGEFKFANRISSFCLKTVDCDPVPVHCTGPGFPDPIPRKGDHRHGNKWRKWRVFNSHWTATMIAGVSNGNIHVHFLILRIEPLDNVSKVVIWITWSDQIYLKSRFDLTAKLTNQNRFQPKSSKPEVNSIIETNNWFLTFDWLTEGSLY